MNHKCPYLSNNKYCTYKNGNIKGRSVCIYSNPKKCQFWNKWVDKIVNEEKSYLTPLKSPKGIHKIRFAIKKLVGIKNG